MPDADATTPVPYYSPHGDFLSAFVEDADAYAEPLGDHLTVYRAMDDNRVVGVKVHALKAVLARSVPGFRGFVADAEPLPFIPTPEDADE